MELTPKDHAEAVAVFRSQLIGALAQRALDHGELHAELVRLSEQAFRPPGSQLTRRYSVTTLERWLYRFRHDGIEGLKPKPRSDRGRARELDAAVRQLLLDIRREHRSASVSLILRTLVADGRLAPGAVSASTIRRLFREAGLDRVGLRDASGSKTRLRWQAERPNALWHGDVCYGPPLVIGREKKPVRIHALLDDASRYVLAIEALHQEREVDMLGLFVRALRRHGAPDVLYLDNGATYRGDILALACARLGLSLVHARPYDPEARGKMERFWRTLREGALDFVGSLSSLHEVNVRLFAFVDEHYHRAAHAGLMGRTPAAVWQEAVAQRPPEPLDERRLREALTVRERRRVRRDTTVDVEGHTYELDQGFLAGRIITAAWCLLDQPLAPWVEHDGEVYALHAVDVVANATRERPPRHPGEPTAAHVDFDPTRALLDRTLGRAARKDT
jgi:putative transposase